MPRYRVEIERTVIYEVEFEIDSDDAADAYDYAQENADDLIAEESDRDVSVRVDMPSRIEE